MIDAFIWVPSAVRGRLFRDRGRLFRDRGRLFRDRGRLRAAGYVVRVAGGDLVAGYNGSGISAVGHVSCSGISHGDPNPQIKESRPSNKTVWWVTPLD